MKDSINIRRPMVARTCANLLIGVGVAFAANVAKVDARVAFLYGIFRIGMFAVSPSAKRDLVEFSIALDIGDVRLYLDFKHHSKVIRDKYGKDANSEIVSFTLIGHALQVKFNGQKLAKIRSPHLREFRHKRGVKNER